MKRGGQDAYQEKSHVPRMLHILSDRVVSGLASGHPPFGVNMPANISKGNQTGVALQRVHPVLYPRILRDVGLAAHPNPHAVAAVVQNGQKNEENFDGKTKRNGLQVPRSAVVFLSAD